MFKNMNIYDFLGSKQHWRKIGKNGRIKYNTFFNSTKVAKFIFEKTLNLKLSEKYFWDR